MSVTVGLSAGAPQLGSPVALFKLPPLLPSAYDASPDGHRFLVSVPVETAEASPLVVVTNWQANLAVTGAR
jgi:hypothetical protein